MSPATSIGESSVSDFSATGTGVEAQLGFETDSGEPGHIRESSRYSWLGFS